MNVFVLGRFPPPNDGQTLSTERLARLLSGNHRVSRLNVEPPPTNYVQNRVAFRPARVVHFLKQRRRIKQTLASQPTSAVFWTNISPSLLGHLRDVTTIAPGFQPDQRVVAVVHRAGFDGLFRGPVTCRTAQRLVDRVDAFVFLNESLSDACSRWIPPRMRFVVPNTIDEDLIFDDDDVARARMKRRNGSPLRVLFLSNMIPQKGYLDLLHAVAVTARTGLDVEADFVGRWGSKRGRADFFKLVDDLGVGDRVRCHGGVDDRDRIKGFYREADVFVLPSFHPTEAQPVVLIEALNAGLPIIASRHGGIPFVVRHEEEGLLVAPRASEEIADAVRLLADDERRQDFAERARSRFIHHFSPNAVAARWESVLAAVAAPDQAQAAES